MRRAYRDAAALTNQRHDRVVRLRAAGGRVDDDPDLLVLDERKCLTFPHMLNICLSEDLLQTVEREAGELGFYEIRAVLSDLCILGCRKTCAQKLVR